ncbi:MAG: alpha/beta fold hydrolase [Candidatus Zeuxoniibacter abyssi]|nr:MAG: alpha/beta fold hydrolase [Candidatus Persebacteraceae bacterium AB1(2)]
MKKLCHFVDEGKGAPLFLVHGIGASHRAWDGVVADMKKSFRCIRYDLRGHGESSVPAYPWRLEDLAADLENLRKKIGEKKIHIAGHSLGAMIGAAYARDYPQRVYSLSLISTAACRSVKDRAKVLAVVKKTEKEGVALVLETLVQRWFSDNFIRRQKKS